MSGLNVEQLLPFAIFGLVAAFGIWLTTYLSGRTTRAMERLDEFKNPGLRRDKEKDTKADAMTKMLEKATPAFAKPLQPKNEYEASKIKAKLGAAGFRGESAVSVFLGLKFMGLMAGLVLGGGTALIFSGITQRTLFTAIIAAGFAFYLADIIVYLVGSSRKEKIFLSLPDALDLLVVCVEAGLGLDQAMRKVSDEMKTTYPVIAYEFGLANFQLQVGRARHEVLHELGSRNGVDDLRSLASILIQADKFGSSVAQALRVQSDSMRVRRRQIAEEKAAKTAVKLIFPLVLFIFPGIFVVLVGPAAITMVNQMFPIMSGGR